MAFWVLCVLLFILYLLSTFFLGVYAFPVLVAIRVVGMICVPIIMYRISATLTIIENDLDLVDQYSVLAKNCGDELVYYEISDIK